MQRMLLLLFCIAYGNVAAQDTTRISLLFAGDVMGHDSQIASAHDPDTDTYDYSRCFQFIRPYIESADVAIANLEVTLAGPPYKGYPQFSSPDALALELKEIGFDAVVTANNHCVDRGRQGLERTVAVLDSLEIAHTGTFTDSVSWLNDNPLLIRKNGFNIALLNYTYGTNGIPVPRNTIVNLIDTAAMRRDILRAKQLEPDVIIVFTHWGLEYQSLPGNNEKELTEMCFRLGVQLVIGSHPHVLQPMEWRKESNQFVAYSLGNFVSGQRKQYTDGGALAYVELQKVRYTPDSSTTTIDTAEYFLEWVYRTVDKDKDYYILPIGKVESDSISFIKDNVSKASLKTFADDSRKLYGLNNLGVTERKALPKMYAEKPKEDDL